MLRNRTLTAFIVLIAAVFILRKNDITPVEVLVKGPRLLQEATNTTVDASASDSNTTATTATNTTSKATVKATNTFASKTYAKLCSGYVYNVPSAAKQSAAIEVTDKIGTIRTKNSFRDLINQQQPHFIQTYIKNFIPFLISIGAPLIVFTILFIFCLINWCCMCCPSCSSLRCGFCDRPSTKRSLRFYTVLSMIFSMAVMGCALACIFVFTSAAPAITGSVCQTTAMLEELYDGKSEVNWFGIQALTNALTNITGNLNYTKVIFDDLQNNFTDLKNDIIDINNDLNDLQTEFNNDTVLRANNISEDRYNPQFTRTMGDGMGTAYNALQTLEDNVTSAQNSFNSAANQFSAKRASVSATLDSSQVQAQDLSKDLQTSLNWLNNNGATIESFGNSMTIGLRVALAILIAITGLSLLSTIVSLWSRSKYFGKFVHLSWLLIGIFMVILWICSTILFPLTVVCVEACDVVNQFLVDPVFANKTMNSIFGSGNNSLKDTITICVSSPDANLVEGFALTNKLSLINNLSTALDNATDSINAGSIPTTLNIELLQSTLNLIGTSQMLDDPRTLADLYLLGNASSLNLATGAKCANVNDFWVLNNNNCTQSAISPVLGPTNPDNFNVGQTLCISLPSWANPSTRNIANRYTDAMYTNCPAISGSSGGQSYPRAEFLQSTVNRFMQNRIDVAALVSNINSQVTMINQKAISLVDNTKTTILEPFAQVKDIVDNLSDIVYNQDTGILYNTQCSFVTGRIESLNEELCVNLIPNIYHTAIALMLGSVLCTILTGALFFTSRKLMSKQTGYDVYRKTYPR